MTTRKIALCLVLLHGAALAQPAPGCEAAAPVGSRIVTPQTKAAMHAADRLVRSAGAGADLRSIRATLLRDRFPSADVDQTLRRMLQVFCEVVRLEATLSDSEKAARIQTADADMLQRVQGPSEVARTSSRIRRTSGPGDGRPILLASQDGSAWLADWLAQAQAAPAAEFLRDAPAYVNDSNKYFVIVGAAPSEAAAIDLMNRLHRKAPQHDFVVYMPYGANPNYAVMMATWVGKDVAQQALRAARQSVVADAFVWACRSGGESC
jgi:hypothetical protein